MPATRTRSLTTGRGRDRRDQARKAYVGRAIPNPFFFVKSAFQAIPIVKMVLGQPPVVFVPIRNPTKLRDHSPRLHSRIIRIVDSIRRFLPCTSLSIGSGV